MDLFLLIYRKITPTETWDTHLSFSTSPQAYYQLRDARQIYPSYWIFLVTHWGCFRKKNGTTRVFPSSVHFRQDTGQMGLNISSEILSLRDRQHLEFHRKSKYWERRVLVFFSPPPLNREVPSPFGVRIGRQGLPIACRHPKKRDIFCLWFKKRRLRQSHLRIHVCMRGLKLKYPQKRLNCLVKKSYQ